MPINTLKIAHIIAMEERYQSFKDSPDIQHSLTSGLKKRLKMFILLPPVIFGLLWAVVSILFGYTALTAIIDKSDMNIVVGTFFFLFMLIFVSSFFMTTSYVSSLTDLGLLEPLLHNPISERSIKKIVFVSWFLSKGIGLYLIVIPATIMCAVVSSSIFLLFFGLVWGFVFLITGHGFCLISSSFFQFRKSSKRFASIKRFIAILALFLCIFIWKIMFPLKPYTEAMVSPIGEHISILWMIFPFISAESIAQSVLGVPSAYVILLSVMYIGLFICVYLRCSTKFLQRLSEPTFPQYKIETYYKPSKFSLKNPIIGITFKDLHLIFRKPMLAVSFFLPWIFGITLIVQVFRGDIISSVYILGMFTLLAVVIASFASLQLFASEGKSAWFLFIQPTTKKTLILGKTLAGVIPFTVCFVPIAVIVCMKLEYSVRTTGALIVSILAMLVYLLIICISILLKYLPDEYTVITHATFGRFMVIFLLIITGFIGITVVGVAYIICLFYNLNIKTIFVHLCIVNLLVLYIVHKSIGTRII